MGKIGAFVAGGVVGACIALACAPQVGRDTRAAVVDKANAAWGSAQGVVSGEVSVKDVAKNVAAQAQDIAQNVAAQAQTFAAQAQEAAAGAAAGVQSRVQEVANGTAATSNDELREKIEAARQRIAAQVVKNVEESQAVAAEAAEAAAPIEAEVEVVEEAAEDAE